MTRVSSKGQVVIPREMREDLKEGEKLVVIKNGAQIILMPTKGFDKRIAEDIEFARRTEAAWKRYDRGEFIEMDFDDFLKRLKKW